MTRAARRWVKRAAFYLTLVLISVPVLFVFYWMILTSLKSQTAVTTYPPIFLFLPTLENYRKVLGSTPFLTFLINSVIVGAGATGLGLMLGLPAAYSIAKFRQHRLAITVLISRMAPGIGYLVPWFMLFSQVGLVDTHLALILTHLILTLPLTIWVMVPFFEDLPPDMEEAALIDGCSWYGVLWHIALPLAKPGVVAAAILSLIFSWNNFLFALILGGDKTRTLPVAVFHFMTFEEVNWGAVAAAATLICLPVILLALAIQRHLVGGLTLGGVKG
jgi:multiple sugar transport system permease protein